MPDNRPQHEHLVQNGQLLQEKKKEMVDGRTYRAFSHDVTAAILVFQNNKTAAMLVYRTNPEGVELFSYVNASFVSINLHRCWSRE